MKYSHQPDPERVSHSATGRAACLGRHGSITGLRIGAAGKIVSGCATISAVGVLGGLGVFPTVGLAVDVCEDVGLAVGVIVAEAGGTGMCGVIVHFGSSVGVGVFTLVDVGSGVAVAGIAVGTAVGGRLVSVDVGVSVAVEVGSSVAVAGIGVAFGNRTW